MKPRHTSNGGSEEIKANIEETRAHMDETLDELTERLQPRHILDDVIDYFRSRPSSGGPRGAKREKVRLVASQAASRVKRTASVAGRGAVRQAREHPLPAILIGAGISMLLMERHRSNDYEAEFVEEDDFGPESYALPQHYAEQSGSSGVMGKIKETGSNLKERAGERLHDLKDEAGERLEDAKRRAAERTQALRRRAREKGAQYRQRAQHTYEESVEAFKRTADERPLAVGLGCLALGVIAGMLIPSTRRENEFVGPARDRIVNRTREVAEDAISRGKRVAQTAAEVAKEEARAQGLTPESLKGKAQSVASRVKETTAEEARQQQQELKQELKQS